MILNNDKHVFFSISILSLYIFFREKYESIDIDSNQKNKDLEIVGEMLNKLEKYQHLPNKHVMLVNTYNKFAECIKNSRIDEVKLFNIVSAIVKDLTEDEKKYILNSVIFVANADEKLSDKEKELIYQVSRLLGFDSTFKIIMKNFNKSELLNSISTTKIVMFFIIAFIFVGAIFYYSFSKNDNVFDDEEKRFVFSSIAFNRYVIYQNTYKTNSYFLKQAIFYLDGNAKIGFNPKNIEYDSLKKELTLLYKDKPFILDISYSQANLIDEIIPESISEKDVEKISGGLALVGATAGGITGANAGDLIKKFTPTYLEKFIKPITGTLGFVAGGTGTYFVAKEVFKDSTMSNQISNSEKSAVVEKSKLAITDLFDNDKVLLNLYIKEFESFIKNKYAYANKEVKTIKYKEVQ